MVRIFTNFLKNVKLEWMFFHLFYFYFFIFLFNFVLLGIWNSVEKRRMFFEKYAKEHNFDPRNPANWYLHPKEKIMLAKVSILRFHLLVVLSIRKNKKSKKKKETKKTSKIRLRLEFGI